MVEKPDQNRLIFQYFQGPLTKFQYIQGLEFYLSNSSIFKVFQDVYEPCNVQLGNKLVCINSITLYLCYHVKKTDFDTIFFLECELL